MLRHRQKARLRNMFRMDSLEDQMIETGLPEVKGNSFSLIKMESALKE